MSPIEKYRKLVNELASARRVGELLDETEAYFAQALCDCCKGMSEEECDEADRVANDVLAGVERCMQRATDAVRQADEALQTAITAFERLRDAEVDLANTADGRERDIGNRGFARADLSLCVLRMLGTE